MTHALRPPETKFNSYQFTAQEGSICVTQATNEQQSHFRRRTAFVRGNAASQDISQNEVYK